MLESVENVLSLIRNFRETYFYAVDPGAFNFLYPIYKERNQHTNIKWIYYSCWIYTFNHYSIQL